MDSALRRPFTDRINAMPKYVASRTLSGEVAWNTKVLEGELVPAVTELRKQDGGDILMYGCGPVSKELMQNGLVDELKLWYNPVFAGEGQQVYNKSSDLPIMDLVKADALKSGIIIATYPASKRGFLRQRNRPPEGLADV